MAFLRSDLRDPSVYTWSVDTGDNPHIRGRPDSDRFDGDEGYEVLTLLNEFSAALALDRNGFQDAEELLLQKPGNVQGRQRALQWLSGHFLPRY